MVNCHAGVEAVLSHPMLFMSCSQLVECNAGNLLLCVDCLWCVPLNFVLTVSAIYHAGSVMPSWHVDSTACFVFLFFSTPLVFVFTGSGLPSRKGGLQQTC